VQQPGPGGAIAGRMGGRRIEKARDPRGTLRRLATYLAGYRWALAGVVLLVLLSGACDLAAPYLTGRAIDQFISVRDAQGLLRLVLALVGLYALSWLAQTAQSVIMARIAQRAMRNLRRELFEHLQTLSLAYFDRHPHGDLMSRLTNDMTALTQVLAQNVTQLVGGLFSLVGVMVMMFVLNFWLALASMVVFPLMMWLVGFVGQRTRQQFRDLQRSMGSMNGQLEELYSGQRVIIAFGREADTMERFQRANRQLRDAGVRAQSYAMLVPPLMGILSNANVGIVAGVGGWMTLQGWATVGTIAAFISYSRQFAAPLRQLGDLYNQIQAALAGAERILEVIDERPEVADAPTAQPLPELRGHVAFDHVCFAYEPGVPVIQDMSFTALPGQTVALVGPTGAGKTTIINLLTRFYDIGSGAICLDGHDIRQVRKHDLRRQLGIVLQDSFLFTGTVMDNIRYGRLDASDEEVVAAARLANADPFIRRLPHGYQSELSERGGNLSQGQRQLVAIARAVLANPRILVLDEATSSVDTRTEVHIQEALLRLMAGRTSLVIAHRLSTIRDADVVLVIRDGQVIERGTHEQLLALGGFYHHLYQSQFKGQAI
jgi:ATP-binding cassette subfamily B protein